MSFPFNVRVYGALICRDHILISDEKVKDFSFTKLPGGGLEFGEGTLECLKREFMEEAALKVRVVRHLYTTDFFQVSAFNKDHQVVSIYYLVEALGLNGPSPVISQEEDQNFRWISLSDLSEEDFTFPIDKGLVPQLKALG